VTSGGRNNQTDLTGERCWTGKNSNGSCRSITRGAAGYGKATYRNTIDKVDVNAGVCPVFGCIAIGLNGGDLYFVGGPGLAVASPGVQLAKASSKKGAECESKGNQVFVSLALVKNLGKWFAPQFAWEWGDLEDIPDGDAGVTAVAPGGWGGGYVHLWGCEF
jgi:hypothetical protein